MTSEWNRDSISLGRFRIKSTERYTMREDVKPCETICNNHNEVMWMLREFKKTGDMWYINQSIKLIKYCKKQGQSLENRLSKWNDLITRQMGYKRVYKPIKGKELKSWQKEA